MYGTATMFCAKYGAHELQPATQDLLGRALAGNFRGYNGF